MPCGDTTLTKHVVEMVNVLKWRCIVVEERMTKRSLGGGATWDGVGDSLGGDEEQVGQWLEGLFGECDRKDESKAWQMAWDHLACFLLPPFNK
nr:hypothetical protein [Tanacetum cinerariifolium]